MHGRKQGGSGGMGGLIMNQRLRLADADGNLLVDTGDQNASGTLSATERMNAIPIQVDGRLAGYLLAEGGMGFNSSDERFLLNRLTRAAFTASLIAGGVSLLLALLLTYSLMRPVRLLTKAAKRLGAGDLTQRVPVNGKDELAVLAQAFNHMADSLQQSEESRRSMTADIAHELRTPLAVERANLEALQDGIYPLTPENLAPILEQNLLLTRLVEDLRTLALAESGQLKLERTPTHLPELVDKVAERFRPQAAGREIELRTGTCMPEADTMQADVDPQRIEQILSNMISNALRYTPDGGWVELRCAQEKGKALIILQDSGPGIPPEALPHVFERFYRADRSRSRSEGGSGLGLAIARQLAEAQGGSLTAANAPQGGAQFTLSLPTR
jgi:two-component system OmpR family sensor kinase/two-component system sensor histidine kinase BaeS